eukprot:TRINITY_DN5084_c0_g1_i2.p1 TRINITY_DN5084_c0_g1~~TRINITY_DN5084_c0_g1_i2.p1  ORF type:complete len:2062 (-),score=576.17 TRINITY_DN5084_c0_g1_i2:5-6190(-)
MVVEAAMSFHKEEEVVAAVRLQMEALEEKLCGQLSRVRQKGDLIHDATLTRIGAEFDSVKRLQQNLDQRGAQAPEDRWLFQELRTEQAAALADLDARWRERQSRLEEAWTQQLTAAFQGRHCSESLEERPQLHKLEERLQRVEDAVQARSRRDEVAMTPTQNVEDLSATLAALRNRQELADKNFEQLTTFINSKIAGESGLLRQHDERLDQIEQARGQDLASLQERLAGLEASVKKSLDVFDSMHEKVSSALAVAANNEEALCEEKQRHALLEAGQRAHAELLHKVQDELNERLLRLEMAQRSVSRQDDHAATEDLARLHERLSSMEEDLQALLLAVQKEAERARSPERSRRVEHSADLLVLRQSVEVLEKRLLSLEEGSDVVGLRDSSEGGAAIEVDSRLSRTEKELEAVRVTLRSHEEDAQRRASRAESGLETVCAAVRERQEELVRQADLLETLRASVSAVTGRLEEETTSLKVSLREREDQAFQQAALMDEFRSAALKPFSKTPAETGALTVSKTVVEPQDMEGRDQVSQEIQHLRDSANEAASKTAAELERLRSEDRLLQEEVRTLRDSLAEVASKSAAAELDSLRGNDRSWQDEVQRLRDSMTEVVPRTAAPELEELRSSEQQRRQEELQSLRESLARLSSKTAAELEGLRSSDRTRQDELQRLRDSLSEVASKATGEVERVRGETERARHGEVKSIRESVAEIASRLTAELEGWRGIDRSREEEMQAIRHSVTELASKTASDVGCLQRNDRTRQDEIRRISDTAAELTSKSIADIEEWRGDSRTRQDELQSIRASVKEVASKLTVELEGWRRIDRSRQEEMQAIRHSVTELDAKTAADVEGLQRSDRVRQDEIRSMRDSTAEIATRSTAELEGRRGDSDSRHQEELQAVRASVDEVASKLSAEVEGWRGIERSRQEDMRAIRNSLEEAASKTTAELEGLRSNGRSLEDLIQSTRRSVTEVVSKTVAELEESRSHDRERRDEIRTIRDSVTEVASKMAADLDNLRHGDRSWQEEVQRLRSSVSEVAFLGDDGDQLEGLRLGDIQRQEEVQRLRDSVTQLTSTTSVELEGLRNLERVRQEELGRLRESVTEVTSKSVAFSAELGHVRSNGQTLQEEVQRLRNSVKDRAAEMQALRTNDETRQEEARRHAEILEDLRNSALESLRAAVHTSEVQAQRHSFEFEGLQTTCQETATQVSSHVEAMRAALVVLQEQVESQALHLESLQASAKAVEDTASADAEASREAVRQQAEAINRQAKQLERLESAVGAAAEKAVRNTEAVQRALKAREEEAAQLEGLESAAGAAADKAVREIEAVKTALQAWEGEATRLSQRLEVLEDVDGGAFAKLTEQVESLQSAVSMRNQSMEEQGGQLEALRKATVETAENSAHDIAAMRRELQAAAAAAIAHAEQLEERNLQTAAAEALEGQLAESASFAASVRERLQALEDAAESCKVLDLLERQEEALRTLDGRLTERLEEQEARTLDAVKGLQHRLFRLEDFESRFGMLASEREVAELQRQFAASQQELRQGRSELRHTQVASQEECMDALRTLETRLAHRIEEQEKTLQDEDRRTMSLAKDVQLRLEQLEASESRRSREEAEDRREEIAKLRNTTASLQEEFRQSRTSVGTQEADLERLRSLYNTVMRKADEQETTTGKLERALEDAMQKNEECREEVATIKQTWQSELLILQEQSLEGKSSLESLHEQLQDVVQKMEAFSMMAQLEDVKQVDMPAEGVVGKEVAALEEKLDSLRQEIREHDSRAEAQEERLKSLRTLLDAREEHFRWVSEKLERSDPDLKLKEQQLQLQELCKGRLELAERLEVALHRLGEQEQLHDDLNESFRRIEHKVRSFADGDVSLTLSTVDTSSMEVSLEIRQCVDRLDAAEMQLQRSVEQLEGLRTAQAAGPPLEELAACFEQLAPRVLQHDTRIRELVAAVEKLEEASQRARQDQELAGASAGARSADAAEFADRCTEDAADAAAFGSVSSLQTGSMEDRLQHLEARISCLNVEVLSSPMSGESSQPVGPQRRTSSSAGEGRRHSSASATANDVVVYEC